MVQQDHAIAYSREDRLIRSVFVSPARSTRVGTLLCIPSKRIRTTQVYVYRVRV